jgi:hypothetical protein
MVGQALAQHLDCIVAAVDDGHDRIVSGSRHINDGSQRRGHYRRRG